GRGALLARGQCLSRRQLHPPARPPDHQRGQPLVARVVRWSICRRRDHRTPDGAASASVDHGPAVAHPASRRGAWPHQRPPGRLEGHWQRDHRLVQGTFRLAVSRFIGRIHTHRRRTEKDGMALAPGRFEYPPIIERPIIKWPGNARVAFWVAPNMEFFEYLPENRPTQPDIPYYSRMDYGNRVGFWRMLEVLNKNNV